MTGDAAPAFLGADYGLSLADQGTWADYGLSLADQGTHEWPGGAGRDRHVGFCFADLFIVVVSFFFSA